MLLNMTGFGRKASTLLFTVGFRADLYARHRLCRADNGSCHVCALAANGQEACSMICVPRLPRHCLTVALSALSRRHASAREAPASRQGVDADGAPRHMERDRAQRDHDQDVHSELHASYHRP